MKDPFCSLVLLFSSGGHFFRDRIVCFHSSHQIFLGEGAEKKLQSKILRLLAAIQRPAQALPPSQLSHPTLSSTHIQRLLTTTQQETQLESILIIQNLLETAPAT